MPWRTRDVLEQRVRFVLTYLEGDWPLSELCRRFGISRKTAYKFLGRYQEGGIEALRDQSRAVEHHPNAVSGAVARLLVRARRRHPSWGPRKILSALSRQRSDVRWPAASTVSVLWRRAGLAARRRRRRATPAGSPLTAPLAPNDLWCADFKGALCARNGERCAPLTVTDATSRYVLSCQPLARSDSAHVRAAFIPIFRAVGLPRALRTDNGPPFASVGLAGLSRLSVWWLKLGITHERIPPGQPQYNARHERMHLTLQQMVGGRPRASALALRRACAAFQRDFNHHRPHDALGARYPAEVYTPSPRPYPTVLGPMEYPAAFAVRTVHSKGEIKWRGGQVFVSKALIGERIGLEPVDDHHWAVHFGPLVLARLDDRQCIIVPYRTPLPGRGGNALRS